MSSVESTPTFDLFVQPADRLFKAADLSAFPAEIPSGPVDYELDNGRLVFIMVPPGDQHGAIQARVSAQLVLQGELKGYGEARTEVGVVLWRDPDRVVAPDAAFIAKKSLPAKTSPEGYLETIPELVVEIRSKNDSTAYINRKVQHYLQAGSAIVWVVDLSAKVVTTHGGDGSSVDFGAGDVVELPGVIPGFQLPVAELFRD